MNLICHICLIEFNSKQSSEEHFKSKRHSESLFFQDSLKKNEIKSEFYCKICSIITNTKDVLEVHLKSNKHQMRLRVKEMIEKFSKSFKLFTLLLV